MRTNLLRELLDAGQPSLGTRIHSSWPAVVEALGHTRAFDYVEFLAEYASFGLFELDNLCRAAELHGLGAMIKIDQEPRTFLAQRAVGAGFGSVLFADVRSSGDAATCVAAVRPETPEAAGTYGVGMRRMAYMDYGGGEGYIAALNGIVAALMIEKRGAVEDLDAILHTSGVDLIQFGPYDYSLTIGKSGHERSPEIRAVEDDVIGRCHDAGVAVRAEIADPHQVERYRELGVRHFSLGVDLVILHAWWSEHGRRVREIIDAQ